ncbi:MAG: SDR family oxidoreductase [bacterium]
MNENPVVGIAIIGLSCRFPGARNAEQYWRNLRDGVESITCFTEEEVIAAGVDRETARDPHYVKAGAVLDEVEMFDAPFFGYTPREARVMDPQQRVFLECAWEAFEDAGIDPEAGAGLTGVFAGAGTNGYLLNQIYSHPEQVKEFDRIEVELGTEWDYLPMRVSYKFNLKGPSVCVKTACSTSLVAMHLACESLLNGQCDVALAGGVSVSIPQKRGYLYTEGGIASPDGHCRSFDADAKGTIFGSGAGVVVLKRLEDALRDGDRVRAVIRGSAVNNDGSGKVGFTAPGVDGQAGVIAEALAIAGVSADTIQYVEAHGTATGLGDPIEIAALTQAFRATTNRRGYCPIGSVKSNFGHTVAAAGIAGLIKTVLAMENRRIPPSLHFRAPNPAIDFDSSPFYVNAKLAEWRSDNGPRRAGVSSFGMGGTNCHMVLEEAPEAEPSSASRPWQTLLLSAKTPEALEQATVNLKEFLIHNPETNLADAAYTLQTGRRAFGCRRVVIAQDVPGARDALELLPPERVFTKRHDGRPPTAVFLFSGQGSQYVGMAKDLYDSEPRFREYVDRCDAILRPVLGFDLRDALYPPAEAMDSATERFTQTAVTQPALFVIEYALAQVWMDWGIRPAAMTGHSLGEYVAACLAGVLSLEDALPLVALRGRLMQEMPRGSMLAVRLPEKEIERYLEWGLSLAAVNGPSFCVLSGPSPLVEELERHLTGQELDCRRLITSHAFHSAMMDPVLEPFAAAVMKISLRDPAIPYISNVTGTWITPAQARDPQYWATHLRQTVRFADGLQTLMQEPECVLLEVGPGNTLATLAKQHTAKGPGHAVLTSLRHPKEKTPDLAMMLSSLGRMWMEGLTPDWSRFYANEKRRRISLPTYPFERHRYWIGAKPAKSEIPAALPARTASDRFARRSDITDWFYFPVWRQSALPLAGRANGSAHAKQRWLLFVDKTGLGNELSRRLESSGHEVIQVSTGDAFVKVSEREFSLRPGVGDDYMSLLKAAAGPVDRIAHAWSVPAGNHDSTNELNEYENFARAQEGGFYSLLFLARALGETQEAHPARIITLTANARDVTGDDLTSPEQSALLGLCKVIPQEYPRLRCQAVDILASELRNGNANRLADDLILELNLTAYDPETAYRNHRRWVLDYEAVRLEAQSAPVPLREGGVYLITGGLGDIGLMLADYLARTYKAKLALTGRAGLPPESEWDTWLSNHDEQDKNNLRIRKVRELRAAGADVLVLAADVSDENQMRAAVDQVRRRWGAIHGVLHAAGLVSGNSFLTLIRDMDRERADLQFQAKVQGWMVLDRVLRGEPLDFALLFSSNAAVLGGVGMAAYAAANQCLDGYARSIRGESAIPWISVNWDEWAIPDADRQNPAMHTSINCFAMRPEESLETFRRIVAHASPALKQIIVSPGDLGARLDQWVRNDSSKPAPRMELAPHKEPAVIPAVPERAATTESPAWTPAPSQPPSGEVVEALSQIWMESLGLDAIGPCDNFFEIGADSLSALRVASKINKRFGTQLTGAVLYANPTIEQLSRLIAPAAASAPVPVSALVPSRAAPRPGLIPDTGLPAPAPAAMYPASRYPVDLTAVREKLELLREASGDASGPRMRRSWWASLVLARLYRFTGLRPWVQSAITRREGGEAFSITLRNLYADWHDIHAEAYSTGCFDGSRFERRTRIGRYTTVSGTVRVLPLRQPLDRLTTSGLLSKPPAKDRDPSQWLLIGNDVWIGPNVVILPEVGKIGNGAVIEAGAVVAQDVPPFAIICRESPAMLRFRFPQEIIQEIHKAPWWDKEYRDLISRTDEFQQPLG